MKGELNKMLDTSRLDECTDYTNIYKNQLEVAYDYWNDGEKEKAGEYLLAMTHYMLSGNDDFITDDKEIRRLMLQMRFSVEKTNKKRKESAKWTETAEQIAEMYKDGMTQQQIGDELELSQSRISKYLDEIRKRRPELLESAEDESIHGMNNNKNQSTRYKDKEKSVGSVSFDSSRNMNKNNEQEEYQTWIDEIPF